MENLDQGLREVIHALNDPNRTIDLRQVSPGDKLLIKVGDRDKDILDFVITEPARKRLQSVEDSARARLPGWKWSSRATDETICILIAGSATLNPKAPYNFTMLSIGKVTLGRNLVIWLDQTDDMTIFRTPIQEATLWKIETQN